MKLLRVTTRSMCVLHALCLMGFISVFMLFAGCAAQVVSQPGGAVNSPYAPVNEHSRTGVVKYLNQGGKEIVDARRDDAYKKMYSACNGLYEIVREGPSQEGGTATTISGTLFWNNSQYWYIEYSCVGPQTSPNSGFIAKPWKSKIDSTNLVFREVATDETPHTDNTPPVQLLSPILADFDFLGGRITLSGVVQNNTIEIIDGISVAFYAVDKLGDRLTESTSYLGSVNGNATKAFSAVLLGINDYRDKATYANRIDYAVIHGASEPITGHIKLLGN